MRTEIAKSRTNAVDGHAQIRKRKKNFVVTI